MRGREKAFAVKFSVASNLGSLVDLGRMRDGTDRVD